MIGTFTYYSRMTVSTDSEKKKKALHNQLSFQVSLLGNSVLYVQQKHGAEIHMQISFLILVIPVIYLILKGKFLNGTKIERSQGN